MKRVFNPWIGNQYKGGGFKGLRILILGEAHYDEEKENMVPDYTTAIIRKLGQTEAFRFHTVVQNIMEGKSGARTIAEKVVFWERVAFYNYIQQFSGCSARSKPTPQMWNEGAEPYAETLNELKPDLVIVLGDRLWNNLPDDPRLLHIQHPSYPGLDHEGAKAAVADKITAVLKENKCHRDR